MAISADHFLLALRVFAGLLIAGHGAQKVFGAFGGQGPVGFRRRVEALGFRPVGLFAFAASFGEFLGGLAVAIGLLTPVAAGILAVDMLVAIFKVHAPNGLWITKNGYEYALTMFVVFVLFGLSGPGAYAIDSAIGIAPWTAPIFLVVFGAAAIVSFVSTARPAAPEKRDQRVA